MTQGSSPPTSRPQRVLIYVPHNRAKTQHALVEAEAAGVVMEPGGSPWQRNTRLKVLAERVFKRIAPDRANAIAAEVEAGRCTLAELDWLADQTGELGTVKLIFGTTAVADVVLTFLNSDTHDEVILTKHALSELTSLFVTEFGLNCSPDQPIGQVRHLSRHTPAGWRGMTANVRSPGTCLTASTGTWNIATRCSTCAQRASIPNWKR